MAMEPGGKKKTNKTRVLADAELQTCLRCERVVGPLHAGLSQSNLHRWSVRVQPLRHGESRVW